ncbi:MAG: NAD(P)/FAD-dependent oxidoreductase [Janthinobacterium lividum]
MLVENVDVLVIGAGPSGSVAASIVKQAGFQVKMVEKTKFPRFVIGESLLPRCMEALEAAGFLPALEAQGFQQKFGAKFVKGDVVADFDFGNKFTEGWGQTWQVPRADFDQVLADEVQRMGVPVEFETEVTAITFDGPNSTTRVTTPAGTEKEIRASFIIDASGYGRVIPRLFSLDRPSNLPGRKTLFAHFEDPNRLLFDEPNRITIIAHRPDVWVWVIPFSTGKTSVGFVGNPAFFEEFAGTPGDMLRAIIQSNDYTSQRFGDSAFAFEPRTLEGWSVTTDQFFGEGFVLTGNVTEFLDPIFSSGVTLATVSGHRAAMLACRQLQGEAIDWQKEYVEPTQQGVNTFRSYVMGWYDGSLQDIIFSDVPTADPEIKRQICSVLAGYVWDLNNPFVRQHDRVLKPLAKVIRMEAALAAGQ